jgi:hypothetical protein
MNENEIVTEVLKTTWFDLRTQLTSAFLTHLDWLNSLGQNASRAALAKGYGRLLETLTEILLRRFPALVDIALHDPTCAYPAEWACEFERKVLNEVMDRKIVLGDDGLDFLDQSIINIVLSRHEEEDDDPYSLLTDFHVEIDNVFGEAVNKAKLQLARHSWKEGGSWEPAESKAVEAITESNARTSVRSRCPYTLEDFEEREDRNRKVFEFYPYLRKAVQDARRFYVETQKKSGRAPSTEEIEKRIPLLKQATEFEHEIVRERTLTPRDATIKVIANRTSLDDETIRRYIAGPTKRK